MIRDLALNLVCLLRGGHRFAWRVDALRPGWEADVLACRTCGAIIDFRSRQTDGRSDGAA